MLFFAGEAFGIGLTQARILRERSRFCKVSALRKVLLCRWRLDMTWYDYNILWRWHHDKHDNTTCCDTLWYAIDRTPRTAEQKHTGRLLVLIHVIHDTFHVPSFNVATWYWRCLSETGSVWICKFTNHTNQCYRQSSVRLINPCESEADKLMYLINQPLRFMSFCWRMLNCVLQCLLFSNCRHCFW